ncbi:IS66 family insertion sequence element accessory protein TnpB [Intestinibacter bartlettii]
MDRVKDVYLVCGAINIRKRIDGLALIEKTKFKKNLYNNSFFVFL